MILAEFGTGQVLWSILWFFLFFMWIWLVITVFADLIRDKELSGWAKAAWTIGIIFVPFLGVLLYLIVRGGHMSDRAVQDAQAQQNAADQYIRSVAGSGESAADQLAKLSDLHNAGKLTDDEYAKMKAKVVG